MGERDRRKKDCYPKYELETANCGSWYTNDYDYERCMANAWANYIRCLSGLPPKVFIPLRRNVEMTRQTRRALEEALALARRSQPEEALALLDKSLAGARQAEDSGAVAILARNAGIISSNVGNIQQAIRYYSEALERQPDDLYLRIALAGEHESQGQPETAREMLSKCHEIAVSVGDEDILEILHEQGFGPGPDA